MYFVTITPYATPHENMAAVSPNAMLAEVYLQQYNTLDAYIDGWNPIIDEASFPAAMQVAVDKADLAIKALKIDFSLSVPNETSYTAVYSGGKVIGHRVDVVLLMSKNPVEFVYPAKSSNKWSIMLRFEMIENVMLK